MNSGEKYFDHHLIKIIVLASLVEKKQCALCKIITNMKCPKDVLIWLQISIIPGLSISFSTLGRISDLYCCKSSINDIFTLALWDIKLWMLLIMTRTAYKSSLIFISSQVNDMPQWISLKVSMVVDAGLYIYLCTGCIVSFALLSRFNSMQTKVFLLSPSNTDIFLSNCYLFMHNVNHRLS